MLGRPGRAFLSSGRGEAENELAAFDAALLDAGVGDANLITVSSVLPRDCEVVEPWSVGNGELLPCVLSKDVGTGRLEAAVAAALSDDDVGMVAEASGPGARERAEAAAREMLGLRGLDVEEVVTACSETESDGRPAAAVAVLAFGADL